MTKEELLASADLFLLDLDGTVYLGGTPIGGMKDTLARLRADGKRLVYLTNNSSKTEAEYRQKLVRMGLWGNGDGVYTSAMATVSFLKEHFAGGKVYLVGTEAVRREFEEGGISLDDAAPDVCVLAYDTELTFEKIRKLDYFLQRGVTFLATHPDDVCPTAYGSMPDVGSFLAMLRKSSGRIPDAVIGKPHAQMGEYLSRLYRLPPERMCMAGDRMHTDIRFANNCGMKSVLVLSGETDRESMGRFPDRPDLVLDSLNDLCGD